MKLRTTLIILLLPILSAGLPLSSPAAPPERILDYHSNINIEESGDVIVRETIRVIAAGDKIKRGIYRTFPTHYRDRFGNRVTVRFQVLEVLRDGRKEPWHTGDTSDGVAVYIGQSDVYLKSGEYTYTLTYLTDRQIGFFEDFDELYWNVTGNEWDFVIEKATAEVRLPPGAGVLEYIAYTGSKGSRGTGYEAHRVGEGSVKFAATRQLAPGEGLTVAVSWPKGIVQEPDVREKALFLLMDNPSTVASLGGLLIVLLYFIPAWVIVGRDPPRGVIVPQFAPPEGYSPAAVRYVMKMGYSDRVLAASVVNMAVKGYLTIEQDNGSYTLRRGEAAPSVLSKGEGKIAGKLFGTRSTVELKKSNHQSIGAAVKALKKGLQTDFQKMHFKLNSRWMIPGLVLTLLALGAMVITANIREQAVFMTLWLGIWSIGVLVLAAAVFKAWQSVITGGRAGANIIPAVAITAFSLPFFVGEAIGLFIFARTTSFLAALVFLLIVGANLLFSHLLKAPTVHGRRVMDRIEGFRTYLEAAEQDRMDRLNPPDRTPELFEKFLPYALALDVENAWAEKFSDVLAGAGVETGEYRPSWYSGRGLGGFNPGSMASSLGSSFASAISSSASPPGSSSGSGGGGSSGGGGGGGGGGGW